MRPFISLIALSVTASPAIADFALLSAEGQTTAVASTDSTPKPELTQPAPRAPAKQKAHASNQKPQLAVGFGNQIPLSFAVRQIVPSRLKVKFGEGVASNALVDWRGGRQWPAVLRDAVRPLGLRVAVHEKSVSIARR